MNSLQTNFLNFYKTKTSCLIKNHLLILFIFTVFLFTDLIAETIQFWTTELQPNRVAEQKTIAETFLNKTGHEVKIITINEDDLNTRVNHALTSHSLPDIIYHPLKYTHPWAESGILNVDINSKLVNQLGRMKFSSRALTMAKYNGMTTALPVAGWTLLVLYRSDIFKAKNLPPPTSFSAITKAVKAIHNPPEMYGFVAPTKPDEDFMSQVLEYIFLANGVSPVNENGYKSLDTRATREVLKFYKFLTETSPPGELYTQQARKYYFSEKAAITIWPTPIINKLDEIGEFSPIIKNNSSSKKLVQKTGIVTTISGPSNPQGSSWVDFYYLGITSNANTEVVKQFIEYYVNQNASSPLSKIPESSSLVKKKTTAPINNTSNFESAIRWGVDQNQLSLAYKINESKIINKVVRRYIDGEINLNRTIRELDRKLSAIK